MLGDYVQISLTGPSTGYAWNQIPIPKMTSGNIEIATNVDGGRNAAGTFIGQTVGADEIKLNLAFPPLTDAEFHGLLALFDRSQGGAFTVWVQFYDPRVQAKVIKQMYVGDRSGEPFRVGDTTVGAPSHWLNVTANLIEV